MFKIISVLLVTFLGLQSRAQMAQQQWGTGQWGGNQGCSYPQRTANAAAGNPVDDETKELSNQIAEAKKQLKAKKNEKQRLERELKRTREDVEGVIAEEYSSFIFEHIESGRQCQDYKGFTGAASEQESPQAGMSDVQGFSTAQWSKVCDASKAASVSASVCDASVFRQSDSRSGGLSCKKALSSYRKDYNQSQKLQNEIERLGRSIERLNDDLKQAKAEAKEAQQERHSAQGQGGGQGQGPGSGTEGDICIECAKSGNGYVAQRSDTNWGNVAANVGVGLAAMYMGYKSNQMVTDANAGIGMPTYGTSSAWSYGLPFLQQGLYGALNSNTGQGGFGCGNTSNQAGGAFGYPQGMMAGNTMGGGMNSYNPYSSMYGSLGLSAGLGYNSYSNPYLSSQYSSQHSSLALQQQMAALTYRMQLMQSGGYDYLGTSGYSSGVYTGPGTPVLSNYIGTSR